MELAEYYGGKKKYVSTCKPRKKTPKSTKYTFGKCKRDAFKTVSKTTKRKGYKSFKARVCNYLKKKSRKTRKKRTRKSAKYARNINPDYYSGKEKLNRPCPTNVSRNSYYKAISKLMGKDISNDPNFTTLNNEDLCDIYTQILNTMAVAKLDDYEMDEYPLPPPPLPSDDWMPPPPDEEEDLPPPPDEDYMRPPPLPNYNLPPPPPLPLYSTAIVPFRPTQPLPPPPPPRSESRKPSLEEIFERELGPDFLKGINKIDISNQPSEPVAYAITVPKITRTVYEELATYPEELQASLLKIYRGQYLTMKELQPLRVYFKIPKTTKDKATNTSRKWSIPTLLAELKKKYREIYG